MSNVAVIEQPQRRSVTVDMAHRFGMEAAAFEATLRATIFKTGTREEFAAFLLVAREYNLNPITREIYAMPKKGGGIIPVVSIDGWVRLANEHTAFDGMEFSADHEGEKLISITCRIHRKDRAHPIEVTEYLSECVRDTEPWKMQHRMLRHKAMIQCARYAFGFAGIYDEDEAERFADGRGRQADRRAPPPPRHVAAIEHRPDDIVEDVPLATAEPKPVERPRRAPAPPQKAPAPQPAPASADPEAVRKRFEEAAAAAQDIDALNEAWERIVTPVEDDLFPPDKDDLASLHRRREHELAP